MREHSTSLRLKIRPDLVAKLDLLTTTRGLSMNEAVNLSLTIAREAKENSHERTSQ